VTDFKTKYGSDPQPFAAQGYDSAGICLKAIEAAAKAKNGEAPTRAEVANAIRALKDYAGITGTVTFNPIGDPIVAKYFVIQVGSADPAKWPENPIKQTLDIAPPAPED
jgi:branched-chain amino acid transport system substrate-binding protein